MYQLYKGAEQAVSDSNMAAATSVVVLDRGNNTTCTINLHGKACVSRFSRYKNTNKLILH